MHLEDLPLDVGYASERVHVKDTNNTVHSLGGQNGKTQLILTTPVIDEMFTQELKKIEEILPKGGEYEVTASIIVANNYHKNPGLEGFDFLIDSDEEFGDYYGVRLRGEPYNNEFAKALILISKDGAIFYDEFVDDIDKEFNSDTLMRKIYAAQTCYTGKGCH